MQLVRIVLVEDDLSSQFLVTETLVAAFEDAGMSVGFGVSAATLEDACTALRTLEPTEGQTLVLVDLNLPDSRGLATWDALTAGFPDLAFVAVTADHEAARALRDLGHPVLTKDRLADLPRLVELLAH